MPDPIYFVAVFLHLARAGAQRRRPHARDRLLVLAAIYAARQNLSRIAAHCRERILQHNPRHLIGRWPSVERALEDPEFLTFALQLERRYPLERAEQMLQTLGVQLGRERETYYSDEEYAAALLNTTPAELEQRYGEGEDEGMRGR